MHKFSVLVYSFLCLICLFTPTRGKSARIFNGTVAEYGQFPFAVALFADRDEFSCSGVLITQSNVLTAATCVLIKFAMAGDIVLLKMEKTAESREWKWITDKRAHPRAIEYYDKYKQILNEYDFAICDLEEGFSINKNIKTIPIAKERIYFEEKCIAVGFGASHMHGSNWRHHYLNYLTLAIKKCNVSEIPENPLYCAFNRHGKAAVGGDIGGPLLNYDPPYLLHGILTSVIDDYSLYASTSNIRRWILSQVTMDVARLRWKLRRKSGACTRYPITIFAIVLSAISVLN